eukprot:COSAG01_NODE_49400_length_372_cov_1.278388_1_plen_42_part_01
MGCGASTPLLQPKVQAAANGTLGRAGFVSGTGTASDVGAAGD